MVEFLGRLEHPRPRSRDPQRFVGKRHRRNGPRRGQVDLSGAAAMAANLKRWLSAPHAHYASPAGYQDLVMFSTIGLAYPPNLMGRKPRPGEASSKRVGRDAHSCFRGTGRCEPRPSCRSQDVPRGLRAFRQDDSKLWVRADSTTDTRPVGEPGPRSSGSLVSVVELRFQRGGKPKRSFLRPHHGTLRSSSGRPASMSTGVWVRSLRSTRTWHGATVVGSRVVAQNGRITLGAGVIKW